MTDPNQVPGELPNMPTGSVPEEIRLKAEHYVEEAMQIDAMNEKIKLLKEGLMLIMATEKVMIVPVIIGGTRYKISYEPGLPKLKIKEIDKVQTEKKV